jgi:adenylyltransferase/sulfurtransferase
MYDALGMTFRTLKLKRDPQCPMCGPNGPDSLESITYTDVSCAIPASPNGSSREVAGEVAR